MSYKQIDEQVEKWYKTQLGTAGDNQKLKNLAHLIYDQAKAEQREEDARIAERKLKEITDGMFNAAINSGRGIGSITEVHYNDACLDIATAIRQEGK